MKPQGANPKARTGVRVVIGVGLVLLAVVVGNELLTWVSPELATAEDKLEGMTRAERSDLAQSIANKVWLYGGGGFVLLIVLTVFFQWLTETLSKQKK